MNEYEIFLLYRLVTRHFFALIINKPFSADVKNLNFKRGHMYKRCNILTRLGVIQLVASSRGLVEATILVDEDIHESEADDPFLLGARQELEDYFSGKLCVFTVKLDLSGLSEFSQSVVKALCNVPYGSTISYGELAKRVGRPHAARAVGRVMAANRLPIFIPCHRVIAASGDLTGYSGGRGLETKKLLLTLEKSG